MANFDPKQFIEEFNKLPAPLKDILSSSLLGKTIEEALSLANISNERYNDLMDITSEVLMLHLPPQSFKDNLISKYQFKETEAQIINQVIQNKIFQPLMPLLKQGPTPLGLTPQEKIVSSFEKTVKKISSFPKKIQFPKIPNILSEQSKTETLETKKEPKSQTIPQIIPEQNTTPFLKIPQKQETPLTPLKKPLTEPLKKSVPQPLEKSLPNGEKTKMEKKEIEEIENLQKEIPEAIEIEIEKPVQQDINVTPINIPEVSPEKQAEIKNTLTQLMTSKKSETPKIVEEMEKIEKTPPSQPQKQESKKEKATAEISQTSKVITGKNNHFIKEKMPSSTDQDKSSIFEIKIKEAKEKKEELPEVRQPISYKKYHPEKPFGET